MLIERIKLREKKDIVIITVFLMLSQDENVVNCVNCVNINSYREIKF